MAQWLNRLSETLHEATQELLELFAINVDAKNSQAGSDTSDSDEQGYQVCFYFMLICLFSAYQISF